MKRITGLLFFILVGWQIAFGQNITGKALDNTGNTMPGVNVVVKGKSIRSITDLNGQYSIKVTSPSDVLVFSYIGYVTKEEPIGNKTVVDVTLQEQSVNIDEVVVVGYGVKKKSLVTGAIASVGSADISNSVSRAEQALQGKATGVQVIASSGSPGAGMKVRIRGAGSNGKSDPLYIVDGMKTGDINFLNTSDIESMEVLKDAASSAIYGTEGANGVVIIKTKSGKAGKSNIEYTFQYGSQSMPATPKVMNASQYATFMTEGHAANYPGLPNPGTLTDPEGTNWFDVVGQTAPMVKHNLTFSGGSDKSTYLVSLGYSKQEGVIGGDKAAFERMSARLNGTHEVKTWLEVGTNVSITNTKRNPITEDDGFNGIVNSALMMDPTVKPTYTPAEMPQYMKTRLAEGKPLVTDANGNYYGISNFLDGELYNPLIRLANEKGIYTETKILSSGYVNLKPMKGLVITSRAGIDLAFGNWNSWSPSYWANNLASNNAPTVTDNDNKWQTVVWENFASYTTKLGLNNITALLGTSTQETFNTWLNTSSGLMIKEDDAFRYPDYVTSRANDRIGGGAVKTRMASYFGRLSYDFDNKYMLEATIRRDGSSLFGSDNKWGNFPSFSAGYLITNESFWKLEAVNMLKLRASWGRNGSVSNLGVDQYRSLITTTGISYPDANGTLLPGAEPALLANSALRWETSEQTDFGFDFQLFKGRVYGSFDYFDKVTKDLLTPSTPALSHGNYAPFANAGNVTNSGAEILIGTRSKTHGFTYDVNFSVTTQKNEVTALSKDVTSIAGASLPTLGAITYFEVGQPVWYFKGYQNDGIFKDQAQITAWKTANKITDPSYNPKPGDPIVKNNTDDGMISDKDMVNIGSPHPDFIYAMNANVGFKGFDFNIFMQGAAGAENFMGFNRADRAETNKLVNFFDDRWTATRTDATMPRAGYNGEYLFKSDLMIGDASYLKIKQIELGYTLPASLTQKAKIAKLRVYFSLNDFFTFTNYKGFDPEVGSGDNTRQGLDFGSYPISRKAMCGLAVTF